MPQSLVNSVFTCVHYTVNKYNYLFQDDVFQNLFRGTLFHNATFNYFMGLLFHKGKGN